MKHKTHSGTKKRVKIRGSGTLAVKKASQNHLLSNKSKRQKSIGLMAIDKTKKDSIRKLLPGQKVN